VEVDFIRDDVVNALIGAKAAFGMTTGDIMFDDLSLYPRLNRIIGQIGLPWYNIGGNHDLNYEAPGAKYSRETFKRTYGPPYYAFEYGGVLFLMLDNVNYFGFDPAKPRGGGKFEGRIGERQLAFIGNMLKEFPADGLVVTCMHIPLRNYLDPKEPATNTVDRTDFLKLISGRPNTVSLAGHTHTTEHHYFGAEDGFAGPSPHHHHVLTAVSGSWWSGPYDHRGIAVADSRDGSRLRAYVDARTAAGRGRGVGRLDAVVTGRVLHDIGPRPDRRNPAHRSQGLRPRSVPAFPET
jgi:3',5'-cyclic AMP phosphodiesterase CpdA